MLLLLIFVLGMTAGLRSLTPLALVAWTSPHRHALEQTWLAFMGWRVTAYIFTALALAELVTDKLPFTPSRLTPVPFGARILSGALCGATLGAAVHQSMAVAALVGAAGGIAGSFAGYRARHRLVTKYRVPDLAVALIEDVIAIATAVLVTHSRRLF
jgi:uncharacterized membrane protein